MTISLVRSILSGSYIGNTCTGEHYELVESISNLTYEEACKWISEFNDPSVKLASHVIMELIHYQNGPLVKRGGWYWVDYPVKCDESKLSVTFGLASKQIGSQNKELKLSACAVRQVGCCNQGEGVLFDNSNVETESVLETDQEDPQDVMWNPETA